MPQPLSVGRLVRVSVNLQPLAAARRGFGTLLLAGASSVIDGLERVRSYTTLEGVAADFGGVANEYLAAALYFGQTPRPARLMIGRWLSAATSALLRGGVLNTAEQLIATWNAITTGSMLITIDGVLKTLTALNFSADANLNAVAARITTALAGSGIVTWDAFSGRFRVVSTTTGLASAVTYGTNHVSGVNIAPLLKLNAATASLPVPGYALETPAQAALALANASAAWYGLQFVETTLTDQNHLDVSQAIEGLDISRIYGITTTNTQAVDPVITTDIGSQLKALARRRSFVVYSSLNPFAAAAAFGRAFSVNFQANRSTITLMYKQMPGVISEVLTENQATALKGKRINSYAAYNNDTNIFQYGVMSGDAYFDEIHGLDWFKDALQNNLYNLLFQSATKIPQTDAGMNQIVASAAEACKEAINNGLVAGGQWNADGFGTLTRGDTLPNGYYIYAQPMALQAQAIRETRVAPPMQIALKLAGAIHEVDAIVSVNR
jgi:Protein of unknown function (DUF3383)